jgi:hypothetical protein
MAKQASGVCSIEGCGQPIKARGWCGAHYKAWTRYGDPLANKRPQYAETCSVEGCGKPQKAKGYCHGHYKKALWYGDPLHQRPERPTCSVEGCTKAAKARGYCGTHYQRFQKHGHADYVRAPKEPPRKPGMLTQEQIRRIQESRGVTTPTELASQFGTTVRTIIAIQAGRTWGWLVK